MTRLLTMRSDDANQSTGPESLRRVRTADLHAEIAEIQARVAALPVLDDRSPEEIIGYDKSGLPS